jgi:F-type H+-transporting ATPase subunit a
MEQLPFTALLNRIFGGAANALLDALHIQHNAHAPINNAVAMQVLVFLILLMTFIYLRTRISVERPGGMQHLFEGIHEFLNGQSREIIGHHYKPYTPYLATLGLYILTSNLIGLVPSLEAPTAVPSVPLGCAVVTWFYYHIQGVKSHGPAYFKHFMGPVWWLAPLMVPIEVFSHLARMLSLTVRLYANMFAGDMVTLVFFSLAPIGIPIIFMGLHIGVAFIQTFIFVLLATVYIGEATAHEH